MKKYNKLEILGFLLLVIGVLSWVSEEFFKMETLAPIYRIGMTVFWLGLAVWALGYMRKEKAGKDK